MPDDFAPCADWTLRQTQGHLKYCTLSIASAQGWFAGFLSSGSFIRWVEIYKFHDILIVNVVWFLSRWNLARDIVKRMSLYMFDDQYQYINRNGFPNEFSFWDHMFPTLSQHCFITCQTPCQAVNRHKVTSTLWGALGMHLPWENDGFRVNLGKAVSCLAKRCG